VSNKVEIKGPSIGFTGLLALLFIGLKLGNVINWSWMWVLSPIWIPMALVASILTFVGVIMLIAALARKRR